VRGIVLDRLSFGIMVKLTELLDLGLYGGHEYLLISGGGERRSLLLPLLGLCPESQEWHDDPSGDMVGLSPPRVDVVSSSDTGIVWFCVVLVGDPNRAVK
jgi:hypothetical protein